MIDREAIRVQRSNAPVDVQSIRSRHCTPQQVRDRSSKNRRLPREAPVEGAPTSLGKANQPRPLAGEFEGLVAGQLLQQRPVGLAADSAALPAPPGKAKSREESRYTYHHTPYGRSGQNLAPSRTVRGRRTRRSPSRSEDEPDSQDDPYSMNMDIAEDVSIFPKTRPRDRRLRLIAKQKEMFGHSQEVYQLGKEKHERARDGVLASQRQQFNKGLLAGVEYDEMMMEFEMEDA
ncbi:hypothetical protein HBI24_078440 [Parastagonospora nodorum]|nr:hypothetical protein HBI24_078440 [Parastagonospora nodorum]